MLPNPFEIGDWFEHLLANALSFLLLSLVDGIFRWLADSPFIWTTAAEDTYAAPALAPWLLAGRLAAGALLPLLLAWGGLKVLAKEVTVTMVVSRLLVALVLAASSTFWVGQAIAINNGLAQLFGPDLVGPPGTEAAQRFNRVLALAGVPDAERTRLVLELTPCLGSSLAGQCQDNPIGRLLVASLAGQADLGQTVLLMPLLVLSLGGGMVLVALLLMVRLAALQLLCVLAPVCLICFGLPGFDRVGRIWVNLFLPTVFVQCVMVLLLAQSRQWMQVGAEHGSLLLSLSSLAAIYLVLKVPGLVGAAVLGQQSWSGAGRGALAAVSAARTLIRR
ncbi:MAG: hypothetical protein IT340_22220 [Chloroflexi bacterium]|nr:hypothetical protein [Chloroflexota bacterium]